MEKTFKEMTFEEKVEAMKACGIHTHEVRVKSTKFPRGNKTYKCFSEEDAYALTHALTKAARELHGEEFLDDYPNTLVELLTEDEFHTLHKHYWQVTCWNVISESRRNPGEVCWREGKGKDEYLFGHRRGAHILANPQSKVFISTGGRDCDGYWWGSTQQFETLSAADEWVDEQYRSSDGGMGWSVITKDQYETGI